MSKDNTPVAGMTAEEFFRNKLKETRKENGEFALSFTTISAEDGLRWAHEFMVIKCAERDKALLKKDKEIEFDRCEIKGLKNIIEGQAQRLKMCFETDIEDLREQLKAKEEMCERLYQPLIELRDYYLKSTGLPASKANGAINEYNNSKQK